MEKLRWQPMLPTIWLLWLMLTKCVLLAAARHIPECQLSMEETGVTAINREGLRALCRIRTLRSELLQPSNNPNRTLTAVSHSLQLTSLHLHCSKKVVFASDIQPATFVAFPRLRKLTIDSCKIKDLPEGAFVGLSELRHLTINTYHRDWPGATLKFEDRSLSELNRLENLDISRSEVWHLPENSICAISSLKTLNLAHNKFHSLQDIGFIPRCKAPITHLLLSFNQIDELPSNSLPTQLLHTLHLDHNKLTHIDDDAFKGLSELQELVLSYNKLVALPQQSFVDLKQLVSLDIANNSLTTLPPALFESLERLLSLNLSHNKLFFSSDNQEPFIGLRRLVVLDLSYNNIDDIAIRTFNHLQFLQILFMQNNKITFLASHIFSKLANLHTLDLANNHLSIIDTGALMGLSVLTHLNLNNNDIWRISDSSFYNCTSLEKLTIAHNRIDQVPLAIRHLKLIQFLDLSDNNIQRLEKSNFEDLHHLRHLSLSRNHLGNISVDAIPRLKALQFLDLSYNRIAGVEFRGLEPLTELVTLNFSHNLLSDINGLVYSLLNLKHLNVSNNVIEWFDYAIVPRNLNELDISHNNIKFLENSHDVHDKVDLRVLIATDNNITEISPTSIPNGIEVIDLSHNLIDFVSSNTFLQKGRVNEINLENNLLTILEEGSIRLPPRSSETSSASPPLLLLSDNPLKCNCGAEWLSQAAQNANRDEILAEQTQQTSLLLPRIGKITDVQCTLPGLWANAKVPIVSVHQHQFLCTYRRHCFALCQCCEFDACDCEQTCPDSCYCYHDHTWTNNIVDCGNRNWTAMPMGVPMDVTEAYLDGNNMGNLTSHALIGRKNLKVLFLNNSNIIDIQNRTFNGLQSLQVLRLDHNHLKKLSGYEFVLLHNLNELYLESNLIEYISNTTFTSLRALEVLRLENNRISVFPVWNLALNPFLVEIGLFDNRWSCECNFLANLKAWLEVNRIKVINVNEISCFHNKTRTIGRKVLSNISGHCDHYVSTEIINNIIMQDYVMYISISFALLLIIVISSFAIIIYRRKIRLWLANRYTEQMFGKSRNFDEKDKFFDVFISHSNKDNNWVYGVLMPELEARGYRACGAYRNCSSPTTPIVAQAVSEGINCSQRLILVVSKGLVDSEWCKYDFKSTHLDAIKKVHKNHLIIIHLDDIPKNELDSELIKIVKKASTKLRLTNSKFLKLLLSSLPSLRQKRRPSIEDSDKRVNSLLLPVHPAEVPKHLTQPIINLTPNPYWETALVTDINQLKVGKPDLVAPPWIGSPSIKNNLSDDGFLQPNEIDHTYVSVSDCEDANLMNKDGGRTSSAGTSSDAPNGNASNFTSGQLSPPLLPLHHQRLVHHYHEDHQYQPANKKLSPANAHNNPDPQPGNFPPNEPMEDFNDDLHINDKGQSLNRNLHYIVSGNGYKLGDQYSGDVANVGMADHSSRSASLADEMDSVKQRSWIHQKNVPKSGKTFYV